MEKKDAIINASVAKAMETRDVIAKEKKVIKDNVSR